MRIEHLTLTNFRGFERVQITLDPRLTVLAGVNGSGKSSVLEGLAVAAGAWFLGFDLVASRNFRDEDVRVAHRELEGQPSLEPQYPCRFDAVGLVDEASASWAREVRRPGGNTTYGEAAAIRTIARSAQQAVAAGAPVDLPVIAYYGAGRLWVQRRAAAEEPEPLGSRTRPYRDCLDPASNLKGLGSWMRRLEQARLQRIAEHDHREALPEDVLRPPALEAVQRAAGAMVDGAERLYFDVAHEELRLSFTDGRRLPFHLLSDGYRSLVALAVDIAWRAVQLNPHHGREAPSVARGVVLIDEVELHLHPSWQQVVLHRLLSAFPRLQLVVTTHAPLVVASTPPACLRFLDHAGVVHQVGVAEGLTVNGVLRHLMDVPERPDEATRNALAELGSLIERGDAGGARAAFERLKARLGDLDPELLTLEWELRDLEVNGAVD